MEVFFPKSPAAEVNLEVHQLLLETTIFCEKYAVMDYGELTVIITKFFRPRAEST